jgi:hypothetical protein
VVGFRIVDDLQSHYHGICLADYLPTQLADLLNDTEAIQEGAEFCAAKDISGFVLVDSDRQDVVFEKGVLKGQPKPVGPAPAERLSRFARHCLKLALVMRSNNNTERVFNHAKIGFSSGGKNVTPMTIGAWMRGKDWVTLGLWGKEKNPELLDMYAKARRFVERYYGKVVSTKALPY